MDASDQTKPVSPALVHTLNFLWNAWCVVSVAGIWPRFIEPEIVRTSKLTLSLPNLPAEFDGLRIVQFTDLHIGPHTSTGLLKRVQRKIHAQAPDVVLFTGDFLCYSRWQESERLGRFLQSIDAPKGCYASLGNHDYASYVGLGKGGQVCIKENPQPPIIGGFHRLIFGAGKGLRKPIENPVPLHEKLEKLVREKSRFQLLNNQVIQLEGKTGGLNIVGLGDVWAGNFDPPKAFADYDTSAPGIICSHNPDTLEELKHYPGEIMLCGHTHGGQVNLPFMRKRFIGIKYPDLYRGYHNVHGKHLYVNRGVGAVFKFRWFAAPEVLSLTLKRGDPNAS